ncbi:MAG: KH domain-containing protein [Verrucomicrobia bacterium]|nr:KH domain-containing protein [Verrucomicrobiota bacterium]
MKTVTDKLRNFLQYVAVKLIDDPTQAQLKVAELGPKRLRFKLVLAQADVAMLIGRNGFTASAVRSVLKAAAEREGVQVSLQIHSHEEEAEMMAREGGGGK